MSRAVSRLDRIHMDVLGELGNVGAGCAATSLSVLMDSKVMVSVSQVGFASAEDIGEQAECGGEAGRCVALGVDFFGEAKGRVSFRMDMDEAANLASCLPVPAEYGTAAADWEGQPMWSSAIHETGNILLSSYMAAFSAFTGLHIELAPPLFTDGAGQGQPLWAEPADGGFFLVEERFSGPAEAGFGKFVLYVNEDSIDPIMSRLASRG